MIRIINQILRQRIRILIKIINHKARKEIKILARRENVPNAANREAIPLRNVHLKNHLRKPKKRTWLQLAIMDLQEGQFRKFWDHDILKTVITKRIVCTFMRKTASRLWTFQAKTMHSMLITQEGLKHRNSERDLLRS